MKTRIYPFIRRHRLLSVLLLLGLLGTGAAVSAYTAQTFRYKCMKCGLTQEFSRPQINPKCPHDGWPMTPD